MRPARLGWASAATVAAGLVGLWMLSGSTPDASALSEPAGRPAHAAGPTTPPPARAATATATASARSERPPAIWPSPTAPFEVPAGIDGCDHAYGTSGECVPWSFPPGVTDGCRWLRTHGYGPLPVVGTDRLQLDADHDNVACGPGDG